MTLRSLVFVSITIFACTPSEIISGVDGGGPRDLGETATVDQGGAADLLEPPSVDGPALYPAGSRHSPVTARIAARWQAVLAGKPSRSTRNFIRLGDNLSHAPHLLGCADRASTLTLGAFSSLQPTVDWFRGGSIAGGSPFAYVRDLENMWTEAALEGSPNLVAQEIATGNPAFALVMFGSLDLGWAGVWEPSAATDGNVVDRFGPNLLEIVDQLLAEGVLPLVRTIAPVGRSNNGPWNRRTTLVNAIARRRRGPRDPMAKPISARAPAVAEPPARWITKSCTPGSSSSGRIVAWLRRATPPTSWTRRLASGLCLASKTSARTRVVDVVVKR
jgi:hypothetical protein